MRRYLVGAGILVVIIAFVFMPEPREIQAASPVEKEVDSPTEEPRIFVMSEAGEEVNARLWKKGTAWCAEAEGFLPNCEFEKEKNVVITLHRDPGEELVDVNITNCSFFAYGPAGAPILGPRECDNIRLRKGRHSFILFDGNGGVTGEFNILVDGKKTISGKKNSEGQMIKIRLYDAENREEVEGWVSTKGFSLKGKEVVIAVDECTTVFAWGRGLKKRDFRLCPGDEVNAVLPKQIGGGSIIISALGAERIIITDKDGVVLDAVEGEEMAILNVPPGAYKIYAENGASVTVRQLDVGNGEHRMSIDLEPGDAKLLTSKHVKVYAMGEEIAKGEGALRVPARTTLKIIVSGKNPRAETTVLIPGEVKVI